MVVLLPVYETAQNIRIMNFYLVSEDPFIFPPKNLTFASILENEQCDSIKD